MGLTSWQSGRLRHFWIILAILSFWGLTGGQPTIAAEYTMKLGHPTANDAMDMGARFFAQEVERLSGGKIKVPVYNASQLGNNEKMNKDVRMGAQECIIQPAGFAVPFVPALGVFDLPFLFPSYDVFEKVIHTQATDPMGEATRKTGVELVGFLQCAFKYFCTTFPMKKAEDLKGRKIRIIQSPVLTTQFKAWGAIPIPMHLGELYTGLQQGACEGFDNPIDLIENMKFYEVSKNVTKSIHAANIIVIMVSKKWLDSLPADMQEAVRKAGRTSITEGIKIQKQFTERSTDIIKAKANYYELPEAEKTKLKTAGMVVWDDMRKDPEKAAAMKPLIQAIEAASK
jgi:tripartite ATP-independent transporter DctP family solute receptor